MSSPSSKRICELRREWRPAWDCRSTGRSLHSVLSRIAMRTAKRVWALKPSGRRLSAEQPGWPHTDRGGDCDCLRASGYMYLAAPTDGRSAGVAEPMTDVAWTGAGERWSVQCSTDMWSRTVLEKSVSGLKYPIFQAPMAGGAATPELVSAVSNAGGLGCLGLGYSPPKAIREAIAAVRRLSDRPFAVNLFAPESWSVTSEQIERGRHGLRPVHEDLGLPASCGALATAEDFDEQLAVVLEARVPVVSFTFGSLSTAHMTALKGNGAFIVGTADDHQRRPSFGGLGRRRRSSGKEQRQEAIVELSPLCPARR